MIYFVIEVNVYIFDLKKGLSITLICYWGKEETLPRGRRIDEIP